MNKLAVLALTLLLFFSAMLWYLAEQSLNDYLKSQVVLQSHYYSAEQAQLIDANFSNTTGIASFTHFSLNNIDGFAEPLVLKANKITAQLAPTPTKQLETPSLQKETTTIIQVKQLHFDHVHAWSEVTSSDTGETNLAILYTKIKTQLALDYPALYPQTSAKLYAKKYPERSEKIALAALGTAPIAKPVETNQAIIASNETKQKNRLLGKASTRVLINAVMIDRLTLTMRQGNQIISKDFSNIALGNIGGDNGLASNQLGGELLRKLLAKLISLENANVLSTTNLNQLKNQITPN
ncbi:hypothetical protein [Colwellia ponticola]|uniref:Uncharacterized protein n=1 Tax=Colwellia ponticola TaxID=2304625 RepID=A0A8H2PLL9_9GAMM|nr:hypothetical protein [Colwellia ponticola]TMM47429.1 hypothetical protein FCS21_00060 [Colwellia ponticola]